MHVQDALDRLDAIHAQLDRVEVYRGFRVPAVACVGGIGLFAAALAPYMTAVAKGPGFVTYWSAVAVLGGLIGTAAGVRSYLVREGDDERRRTRRVVTQMLPGLAVGALATAGVTRWGVDGTPFLPGIWAVLFGLSVVAAAPFLPVAVRWVGFAYVAAGIVLTLRVDPSVDPSPWSVGGVFGLGHFATAYALWTGERSGDSDGDL